MASNTRELRRSYRRGIASIIAMDGFCLAAMVAFWWLVGLADPRLLFAMSIVRGAAWFAYLRQLVTPLREGVSSGRELGDAELLAIDGALQRVAIRSTIAYTIGWAICELSWAAALAAGVPVEIPHGSVEVFAALMFASTVPALGAVHHLMTEGAFLDFHTRISEQISVRGLEPTRPRVRLAAPLIYTATSMMLGTVVLFGGIGMLSTAASERELELTRQQRLAELSAMRVTTGVGGVLEGSEIVEQDMLPDELLRQLPPNHVVPPGEHVTASIPSRDQSLAAASLGGGRWVLCTASIETDMLRLGGLLIVIALSGVPVFNFGFSAYARRITGPLERFGEATAQFVERGELDALERVAPLRGDELGRVAISFNRMLDILGELTAAAEAVSSGDLTVELEHPGGLHDAFRGMLVRLNEIVGRLRETSLELASATAEISALTEEQERAAEVHSASVSEANETVASLAASALQIAESAKGVVEDAERAVATTDATAAKIAELREHTTRIGELLELIREVADRSDLLALNGSLEATRVGEAGRGFALVAGEMRRLAERVTGTVADVHERVADIEASGVGTVSATEHSRALVSRAAEAARDISAVTAKQSADTEQAARAVQSVAELVVQTTRAVSQTRGAAEGLRAHAAELERLVGTFGVRDEGEKGC